MSMPRDRRPISGALPSPVRWGQWVAVVLLLLWLPACARVHRFHVVRCTAQISEERIGEDGAPSISEKGRALRGFQYEDVKITFQRAYAYAPWSKNPGVAVTFLLENMGTSDLVLREDDIAFSRFPPSVQPRGANIPPTYVAVQPGERKSNTWTLPPAVPAKVQVVFRSPARTPGYLTFRLRRMDESKEKQFSFKITRIPPTNS